nr:NADH dehydrogenase subunit 6 [Dipylidium caninum]
MMYVSLFMFFLCVSCVVWCFIVNPVYYCSLLVFNSFLCGYISYMVYGFSWYALLLCLVYVGGVYVLFIFVSFFVPNSSFMCLFDLKVIGVFVSLFFVVFSYGFTYCKIFFDYSYYLCNSVEGCFYVFMSFMLIFSFFVLSMISSLKFNYYR